MDRRIEALIAIARSWGGDVIVAPDDLEFDHLTGSSSGSLFSNNYKPGYYPSPFTSYNMGIFWARKRIIVAPEVKWPDLIHELGHTFASKEHPDLSEEFDFLGWEYLLAKKIRASISAWGKNHSDYGLGKTEDLPISINTKKYGHWTDYGTLSHRDKQRLLQNRIDCAREKGLVRGNEPLTIR